MNYLAILATIQLLTQRVQVLEAELQASQTVQNDPTYVTTPQNPVQVNIEPMGGGVDTVPATTTFVPESDLTPSTTPLPFSDLQDTSTAWSSLTPEQRYSICQRLESGSAGQTANLDPSYTVEQCYQ
jgi:hypothetical protein